MLKYLRIAVTVLSLTACVLLTVLWVRSYWWSDQVCKSFSDARIYRLVSRKGNLQFSRTQMFADRMEARWLTNSSRLPVLSEGALFDPQWGYTQYSPKVSHLSVVLVAATLAAVPWISWSKRFSLRTLLIATTLVAVAMGVVAMSS